MKALLSIFSARFGLNQPRGRALLILLLVVNAPAHATNTYYLPHIIGGSDESMRWISVIEIINSSPNEEAQVTISSFNTGGGLHNSLPYGGKTSAPISEHSLIVASSSVLEIAASSAAQAFYEAWIKIESSIPITISTVLQHRPFGAFPDFSIAYESKQPAYEFLYRGDLETAMVVVNTSSSETAIIDVSSSLQDGSGLLQAQLELEPGEKFTGFLSSTSLFPDFKSSANATRAVTVTSTEPIVILAARVYPKTWVPIITETPGGSTESGQ